MLTSRRLTSASRGLSMDRRALRWRRAVAKVNSLAANMADFSADELARESRGLRFRVRSGEPMQRLLPAAFALVREAADRALGMRHYDVQVLSGAAIFDRCVAEMQTGEGKTLTATLPLYLAALAGDGAHLATANDYLAVRDAELMGPVFQLLGMTVGFVEAATPRPRRKQAYACDVTYGTAKEFGFDFLRDRLFARSHEELGRRDVLGGMLGELDGGQSAETVQRGHFFALIDEADNILIDEARTPLIVSSLPGPGQAALEALYRWAAAVAPDLNEEFHYNYDQKLKAATLTADGRRAVRELSKPPAMAGCELLEIYEQVETALRVSREFLNDRHYVVRDGEVVIVDEFTGRLAEGRKWREGVHQAVEAKEGLPVSVETGEAARVTVQDYFLRYQQLGGMTGTGWTSRGEMNRIYKMRVARIPTHRPTQRQRWPDAMLANQEKKWESIVAEVVELNQLGRPVLIGTRSIDKSELLSEKLTAAGVEHQVLNARQSEDEATVIAAAGCAGRVTVATNMAGRGTDIALGEGVEALGGLHVVGTELHESARIDRQLIGRCGRQGDPGSFRQFMALYDEILQAGLGERSAAAAVAASESSSSSTDLWIRRFYRAQRKVEKSHFRQRRLLMHHERRRRELQRQMGQDPFLDASQ